MIRTTNKNKKCHAFRQTPSSEERLKKVLTYLRKKLKAAYRPVIACITSALITDWCYGKIGFLTCGGSTKNAYISVSKPWQKKEKIIFGENCRQSSAIGLLQSETGHYNYDLVYGDINDYLRMNDDQVLYKKTWDEYFSKSEQEDFIIKGEGLNAIPYYIVSFVVVSRQDDQQLSYASDFFDLRNKPGKRVILANDFSGIMEFALINQGVDATEVYRWLKTKEGIDKAFSSLEKMAGHLIFAQSYEEVGTLILSGEARASFSSHSRVNHLITHQNAPLKIAWDMHFAQTVWLMLFNAPKQKNAIEYVKFLMHSDIQKALFTKTGSSPVSKKAQEQLQSGKITENMPHRYWNNVFVLHGDIWAEQEDYIMKRWEKLKILNGQ